MERTRLDFLFKIKFVNFELCVELCTYEFVAKIYEFQNIKSSYLPNFHSKAQIQSIK